jgi:hypothetical protein
LRGTLRHLAAASGFAVLAAVWSFPLVAHLSTHLPGAVLGDNAVCAWNFWWMRTALASGSDFFQTPYLFAPVGGDLTLHTHTALSAFVGATLFRSLPVVAAVNLTTLLALSLNGFCAYLLAWRLTRDWGAALVAGVIFGTSPYLAAHLNGHFNLTSAWTIPLFAVSVARAIAGSKAWAALSGVVLAVTVYNDYYYVVYELAAGLCMLALAAGEWSLTARAKRAASPWLVVVGIAILLIVATMLAIVSTGGFSVRLGSVQVSMHDTYNPLQVFWVLVGIALWTRVQPRISVRPRETWRWSRAAPALFTLPGVFLIGAAPIVWKGIGLLWRGQFVTQPSYWRSASVGIDVAALVVGNPFHGVWGAAVRRLYAGIGSDVIECGAWLGIAPVVFSVYALKRKKGDMAIRQWAVIGAVFFVWALGPHLLALGRNTGMILPEALLRYVPIVSNVRMPGRAMVMVYLALAMLGAIGAADWSARYGRPSMALFVTGIMVFADFLAAPFPLVPVECPSIYQTLRDRPERGALAELPLGLGDGLLGELTPVNHQMFVCQMIHGRPLVGGVLARLPPNVLPAYEADPLLAGWLGLSGARGDIGRGGPLPDAELAGRRLKADGIAFVLLDREAASPELRDYVEHVLPLTLVAQEKNRVLYSTTQ